MKIQDFEKEIQEIDKDLSIRPVIPPKLFPEAEKLAGVYYKGVSLFTIPNYEIFDETNNAYGVDVMGDGRFIPHRNRIEALNMIRTLVKRINEDKDYGDAFFGRGEYSDAKLKEDTQSPVELVEEVSVDLKEVSGEESIKHPVHEIKETN